MVEEPARLEVPLISETSLSARPAPLVTSVIVLCYNLFIFKLWLRCPKLFPIYGISVLSPIERLRHSDGFLADIAEATAADDLFAYGDV